MVSLLTTAAVATVTAVTRCTSGNSEQLYLSKFLISTKLAPLDN